MSHICHDICVMYDMVGLKLTDKLTDRLAANLLAYKHVFAAL